MHSIWDYEGKKPIAVFETWKNIGYIENVIFILFVRLVWSHFPFEKSTSLNNPRQ